MVALVISAYALAAGAWGTGPEAMEEPGGVVGEGWLGLAYVLAGVAGFAGVFTAPRWPGLGRGLTGLAGLLLLSGLLAMREMTLVAVVSLGITGLALLGAAYWMGPMPTPGEEEAGERGP